MIKATAADEATLAADLRNIAPLSWSTIERRIAADELKAVVLCLRYLDVDLENIARRSGFPLDLLQRIRDRARLS